MTARPLTPAALAAWLARYEEAWEQRDPTRAAALFTENAAYHEMPFDVPKAGRSGHSRLLGDRDGGSARRRLQRRSVVAVNGRTGIARWSAKLKSASSGVRVELDGVFVLTFDDGGLCSELREWWHVRTS